VTDPEYGKEIERSRNKKRKNQRSRWRDNWAEKGW